MTARRTADGGAADAPDAPAEPAPAMRRYLDLFLEESREHLDRLARGLESLAATPEAPSVPALIEELFRSAHSLKGMSATMGFDDIAVIAHRLEDALETLRAAGSPGTNPAQPGPGPSAIRARVERLVAQTDTLRRRVDSIERPSSGADDGRPDARPASAGEPAPAPLRDEPPGNAAPPASTLRVGTERLDSCLEAAADLVVQRGRLRRRLDVDNDPDLRLELERLGRAVERIFRDVMDLRLQRFDSIAHRFARAVREQAAGAGRAAALEVSGGDALLDRSTLEALVDPVLHLLRNAVCHGLESPDERRSRDKPPEGRITLKVGRVGGGVVVSVRDDGRGMDARAILERALATGRLGREEARSLPPEEVLMLATQPGFTTTPSPDAQSGRGVGLDVVRSRVEELGGRLRLRSDPGHGTEVKLHLPSSLLLLRAFVVECGGRSWAVPVRGVRRVVPEADHGIDSGGDPERASAAPLRVIDLAERLGLGPSVTAGGGEESASGQAGVSRGHGPLLVTGPPGARRGLRVDAVLGEAEVIVRPLGAPLNEMREYSGATLLPEGRIALVIDPSAL